jgi:hypothetical protein
MRATILALAAVVVVCPSCKGKKKRAAGETSSSKDAGTTAAPGAGARMDPSPKPPATWVLRLPAPRFEELADKSMGPLMDGDRALVSSSQIGTLAVDARSGKVLGDGGEVVFPGSAADRLRTLPEEAKRESRYGRVRGWASIPGAYFVVWDRAVARVGAKSGKVEWTHPLAEQVALGVAGPMVAGDWVVWVRDEVLEARRRDGSDYRQALGQYASCRRCLALGKSGVHSSVRAIRRDARVEDGVVFMAPAAWVPARQAATFGEPMIRSGQVLDALFGKVGVDRFPLIMVVRRDSSLRNDAVEMLGFLGLGKPGPRLTWKLPPPNGRRAEPVRVARHGDGLLVFYDGRYLARLNLAAPANPKP